MSLSRLVWFGKCANGKVRHMADEHEQTKLRVPFRNFLPEQKAVVGKRTVEYSVDNFVLYGNASTTALHNAVLHSGHSCACIKFFCTV